MITKKEYFRKRVLYFSSFILIYFVPAILIFTKLMQVDYSESPLVKWNIGMFVVALIFVFVFLKFINKKLKEMKPNAIKPLILGIRDILPFAAVAGLAYVIETALTGVNITLYCVMGCMAVGYCMQSIDMIINKKFLYEWELQKLAKEDLDREEYKDKIKKGLEEEKELEGDN